MLVGTETRLFPQTTAQQAEEFEVMAGYVPLVLEQIVFVCDTEHDNAAAGMGCTGQTVRTAVVISRVLCANDGESTDCICCFSVTVCVT